MSSFKTMAQPMKESFKIKVRLSEKQRKRVNLAALVFMGVMTLFAILVNQI